MIQEKLRRQMARWLPCALPLLLVCAVVLSPLPAQAQSADRPAPPLTISYADAAGWLDRLPSEDRDDQIRDYALLGLASLLGLDLPDLRNALYDQTPLRDPLFWDLAANHSGPGRGLYDGHGTLHVLVPQDDAYAPRTIGLVLDDHRKDSGQDADQVVIYHYTIDEAEQQVQLQPDPPLPASQVRQAYGYVEMAIRSLADLERFLGQTQHLSQVAIQNGTLRLAGWHWPGVPSGQVTAADLTVLQRGYLAARGEPVTVEQFITENLAPEYGLTLTIPADVKAHARELDAFFTTLVGAEQDDEYVALLTDYEDLVLAVILDDATAQRLDRSRTTQNEIAWFNDYAQAFVDTFEANELWGVLHYVAAGDLYRPEPGVTEPGFSLDPGPPLSLAELLALLPESLYPELAGRHAEVLTFVESYLGNIDGEAFWDFLVEHQDFILNVVLDAQTAPKAESLWAIVETGRSNVQRQEAFSAYFDLIDAALSDHDRPWPLLLYTAWGEPPYQYARYDGGLQGTEAGMTYFYTDILAKGYFYELGQGNPYGIVEGFTPRSHASVPWSHCTLEDQQGRIWFGLREEAIGLLPQQVNLGSVATRVFVLMQDPAGNEQEVEPSYMFGQGIWWWDRHYQAMADYEPQYHRLDQLMRWGAVLAWLVEQDTVLLPEAPDAEIARDWRFDAWLAAHPELTWQYDVPFVEVPGQPTESVLRLFSLPHELCGRSWVSSGGISNPSLGRVAEIAAARPDLPPAVARGGQDAAQTDFSSLHESGTIASLDGIRRTLQPIAADTATVEVVAQGRKVWSLGALRVALPETNERRLQTVLSGSDAQVAWRMEVQEVPLGALTVRTEGTRAAVQWEAGPLAHVQDLLDELQDLLLEVALEVALEQLGGDDPAFSDPASGAYYLPLNNMEGEPQWLAITAEPSSDAKTLSFRLAHPVPEGEGASEIGWYYASLTTELPPNLESLP